MRVEGKEKVRMKGSCLKSNQWVKAKLRIFSWDLCTECTCSSVLSQVRFSSISQHCGAAPFADSGEDEKCHCASFRGLEIEAPAHPRVEL